MSLSRQYRQQNAPEVSPDDSESDLDIDLQELDPASSSSFVRSSSRRHGRTQRGLRDNHKGDEEQREHIALRSWRSSGLRGQSRNSRGYEEVGKDQAAEAEDTHGLDDDYIGDFNTRPSAASFGSSRDDAPLLHPGQEKQGKRTRTSSGDKRGTLHRLGSRLQLPRFLPNSLIASHPAEDVLSEPEEDHNPKSTRTVLVGHLQPSRYPPNAVSNAKYTAWSFLPHTLYNEFSFFFNLYFLLVALSQVVPALRIGYLSTYIAPLAFVLAITLGKEALDDIARRRRDAESNSEGYTVLRFDRGAAQNSSKNKVPLTSTRLTKERQKNHENSLRDQGKPLSKTKMGGDDREPAPSEAPSGYTVREVVRKSRDLKVGDVLKMGKDQRVPADVIILRSYSNENSLGLAAPDAGQSSYTSSATNLVDPILDASADEERPSGLRTESGTGQDGDRQSAGGETVTETFLRTDQLDGETDWKLRLASPLTQSLDLSELALLQVVAGKPDKRVNEFVGTIQIDPTHEDGRAKHNSVIEQPDSANSIRRGPKSGSAPLTIDNTAWANTVLASNSTTLAVVIYTGPQTRQALSTASSRSKTGLLEYEINSLTKILCVLTTALSVILVALEGFKSTEERKWYVAIMRFLILFSTIIPISLRVNLDMGKSVYAWFIERDQDIRGAIVRTSTIPEELGRLEYLLSDKTGTLTQNEMEMKKIHVGTVSYANEAMEEVSSYTRQAFSLQGPDANQPGELVTPSSIYTAPSISSTAMRTRREIGSRVRDVVLALALCHNVTPMTEGEAGNGTTTYQASSPDEIAIVRWTESVGLRLVHRDRKSMALQSMDSHRVVVRVRILDIFPFTSDGKRMGIIVQFFEGEQSPDCNSENSGDVWFYQKGADTVMSSIVAANDWLDEETANMAREGLRTLVVGRKKLSTQQYKEFSSRYKEASLTLHGRDGNMSKVVKDHLELDLELLGVTGVEDKLQHDVKPSLELLRNAGIKIWMLTGDKVETARCVAVSSKLVARGQYIHTIAKLKRKDMAQDSLDFLRSKTDACLLIDGESLALLLQYYRDSFISLAVLLPAVIACRCSPTQKADVAKLIRSYTKKRICCIGDGGNDVSMIQAADVGVGIVGKEGRQASLSADFSIDHFCHLTKLLVWHGRNSYKRSAKLAQFVIHRGLIISVCQTMYSIASEFEPVALYKDWLLVGYATVYTMAPVFSLVLDKDVDEQLANLYPELYKELTEGRSLSYRTFFIWVIVSIYQGGIIQGLSQILVSVDGPRMVSVSFTVLVINELIMVAFEVTTWHPVMIFSLLGTALIYFGSIPFLGRYFDLAFVLTWGFLWKVTAISAISLIPPYAMKLLQRTLKPPSYRKVQGL
ncbi:MAG: putative aminophospholipid-translocase [Sclerophora amabilis]|nr:MAG: putative aminophospholipid-translocase [Sclerophora amabilis]